MAPLVANVNNEEYKKKADLMIAAGEQIDFLRSSALYELTEWVDNGVVEPLDDYAGKAGVNLMDEYKGLAIYKDKIYAIPEEITPWLVFINKDMLDAAGLPVPPRDWTWDDYREYAKKLSTGEGANKVYGSFMNDWSNFFTVGTQSEIMDNPLFTEDNKPNFDHPTYRGGLQFRYDLENVDKSQVPYADMSSQKLKYRTQFFGGKVAMVPMGSWMVTDIQLKDKYPHTFKTTFATYPRWSKNTKPNTSQLDGAGMGWSINAKSAHKEAAYKFLTAMTSEGLELAHNTWTAWKKTNADEMIRGIVGSDESLYDLEAFKSVIFDPERVDNIITRSGPGESEIIDAFTEEAEKYFVGGQSLDSTLKNTINKANAIVEKTKK
jgi:multiple sugar transport system substrate-binding protein